MIKLYIQMNKFVFLRNLIHFQLLNLVVTRLSVEYSTIFALDDLKLQRLRYLLLAKTDRKVWECEMF